MPNYNIKRLNEDILRELSTAVPGVKDPRVADGFVTVTRCELTSDLSYCKVWVACMGGEERTAKAVEGMKAAGGYFKKRIAARVRMRKMPELIFISDNSLDYSARIDEIIKGFPKRAEDENTESEGFDED